MTDLKGQHLSTIALGFLLLASTANSANAQIRIDKDQTGRIVAMANLSTASGCSSASGVGQVVDHHFEFGQMKGVTFKHAKRGESYLNLPWLNTISPASARARVAEGFATLLVKGQDLKVVTLGCGAAGRIEKLAAVELVGPSARSARAGGGSSAVRSPAVSPDAGVRTEDADDSVLRSPDGRAVGSAAPASSPSRPQTAPEAPPRQQANQPSRWRFSQSGPTQVHLLIRSDDRAFSFAIHCERRKDGLAFRHVFDLPHNWNIADSATPASIDGRPQRWEVDGTFEGAFFSDNLEGSSMSLSGASLRQIASGERFVIHGKRSKPRDAVFNTVGGEQAFAAFEARCQKLRIS